MPSRSTATQSRKRTRDTSEPGDADRFHLVFAAEPLKVRDALRRAVARFARRITVEDAGTLEIALAEALNNIVEHAYSGLPAGPIDLYLTFDGQNLHCRIVDHGRPMPRLALPQFTAPQIAESIAELSEGGWGWALIGTLSADLDYRRENGNNCLSFRIPLAER